VGVPASDDFFTDAVLNTAINEAIMTVDAEQRWPWNEVVSLATVAAGSTGFIPPDNWRATRALYNGATELVAVAPEDVLKATGTSGPQVYAPVNFNIWVAPRSTSDVVLTHYWYQATVPLVVDSDITAIPYLFSEAIVCKAAELLSAREDDSSARAAHAADYEKWIARMRRDVRRSTGPVVPRVRPGGWI
jgi:hypothetical protein